MKREAVLLLLIFPRVEAVFVAECNAKKRECSTLCVYVVLSSLVELLACFAPPEPPVRVFLSSLSLTLFSGRECLPVCPVPAVLQFLFSLSLLSCVLPFALPFSSASIYPSPGSS